MVFLNTIFNDETAMAFLNKLRTENLTMSEVDYFVKGFVFFSRSTVDEGYGP